MKNYTDFLAESLLESSTVFKSGNLSVNKDGIFQIGNKTFIPGNKDTASFKKVLASGAGKATASLSGKTAGIMIDDKQAYFEYDGERAILSGSKLDQFKKFLS